jgi:hypothetical protein
VSDQPFVDCWPMWDEPLSKVPAAFDIDGARERLARKYNARPVRLPRAVEIERSWEAHNESVRRSIGPRRKANARNA